MPKLTVICPTCQKDWDAWHEKLKAKTLTVEEKKNKPRNPIHGVEQEREFNLGSTKFIVYSCGHAHSVALSSTAPEFDYGITSDSGKKLWTFQQNTLKFYRDSGFCCLANLDMGLGKTPITCAAFKAFPEEMLPNLTICKSSLKHQWARMGVDWGGIEVPQIIENGKDELLPEFFKMAIVSFDLLRRMKIPLETLAKYKSIVIDETQNIKNPDTKRTQNVRKIANAIPHRIGLSGTPIKNNGTEYFTILNILRPDMFPNYNTFCWNWVDNFWDGRRFKYGGIKRYEQFRERTSNFIIRYTRDEVMPDLPKIFRQEQFHELGPEVNKAYQNALDEFSTAYFEGEFEGNSGFMNLLAYMSRMRHITGMAKIKPCLDYLKEFLHETDRKIVVFCHHTDVMTILKDNLIKLSKSTNSEDEDNGNGSIEPEEYIPLMYTSDLSSEKRDETITKFLNSPDKRIMIASTLSLQEGVNLQPVADCIMLERQWNPANEEQAESRFPRPGATADKINAIYMIAIGTIDEYFAELVERKRQFCKQSVGDKPVNWDETSLMKELAATLAAKGNKKWTL